MRNNEEYVLFVFYCFTNPNETIIYTDGDAGPVHEGDCRLQHHSRLHQVGGVHGKGARVRKGSS